jgi:hypothetical protein
MIDDDMKGCPPSLRESDHDVTALIRLAEWARNNGFLIGDVTIGSLSLKIRDLRIEDHEGLKPNKAQQSIWAEHGFDEPLPDGDGTVG